jgi:hypothetical protein
MIIRVSLKGPYGREVILQGLFGRGGLQGLSWGTKYDMVDGPGAVDTIWGGMGFDGVTAFNP